MGYHYKLGNSLNPHHPMNVLQLIPYIVCAALTGLSGTLIYWLTSGLLYFKTVVEAIAVWLILTVAAMILITFVTLKTQQLVSDYRLRATHQVYESYRYHV